MLISEIFASLSGEGIHAGIPTVFIRLAGCNLDCSFCDAQYARKGGEDMTPLQIDDRVKNFNSKYGWTVITGGEPLVQDVFELVRQLKGSRYKVEIETNGSVDPPFWFKLVDCWSVDVKCPSSGPAYGTFRRRWLTKLRKQDQLKFVVGTQEDLDFVKGFLSGARLRPTILVSPIAGILLNKKEKTVEEYWNREWLQEVAELCLEQNVRMSLQLHKIIWGNKKGV